MPCHANAKRQRQRDLAFVRHLCGYVLLLVAAVNVHVSYTMPFPVAGAFLLVERLASAYLVYFSTKFLFFERGEYVFGEVLVPWILLIFYLLFTLIFVSPEPSRFVPGSLVSVTWICIQLVSLLVLVVVAQAQMAEHHEEGKRGIV